MHLSLLIRGLLFSFLLIRISFGEWIPREFTDIINKRYFASSIVSDIFEETSICKNKTQYELWLILSIWTGHCVALCRAVFNCTALNYNFYKSKCSLTNKTKLNWEVDSKISVHADKFRIICKDKCIEIQFWIEKDFNLNTFIIGPPLIVARKYFC